jgi:thymidylate kinase
MVTVALLGGDGAGKTTVAKNLEKSAPLPMKYMYMGISPISSNVALPTTRMAGLLRVRAYKKEVIKAGKRPRDAISTHDLHYRSVKRGSIWVAARTLNRLVDFMYRQLVSWRYQRQGYVVVYDRHLVFETAGATSDSGAKKRKRLARIQHWLLSNLYPQPDLVIFLDAPAEVLYGRKGEATLDYLERRRRVILEQGKQMANFVRVDASRSFDQVLADVTQQIMEFLASTYPQDAGDNRKPALMEER